MTNLLKSEQYIKEHRDETIETMCNFALTDALLFWSNDKEIVKRQKKIWQPFLDDLQNENNVKINISQNLQIPENELFLKALREKLICLSDKELTVAFLAATEMKSVILGLSVLDEKMSTERVFNAAFLEEIFQNELWGIDEQALERRENIKSELQKMREFLYNV